MSIENVWNVKIGEITPRMEEVFIGAVVMEVSIKAHGLKWLIEFRTSKNDQLAVLRFVTGYLKEFNAMDYVGQEIRSIEVGPRGGTLLRLSSGFFMEIYEGER